METTSMDMTDRIAVMQQFGRTYRAFMQAFEAQVGQPMPRWRILLALHESYASMISFPGISGRYRSSFFRSARYLGRLPGVLYIW